MESQTRRRLICNLAAMSATVAIGAHEMKAAPAQKHPQKKSSSVAPSKSDLYVIFSGPWITWIDSIGAINLSLRTIDDSAHSYTFFDTSDESGTSKVIAPGDVISLAVAGHAAPPDNSTLFEKMAGKNQGLFYNSRVTLSTTPNPKQRIINISRPTSIKPAALMKGAEFSLDNSFTSNGSVDEWPSSLLFVFSGWTFATVFGNSVPIQSYSSDGSPRHLEFRIMPSNTTMPVCDPSSATHVQNYFNNLMTLLSFPARSPSVTIPPCVGGVNPIQFRSGDDPNISCSEIGITGNCDNQFHPVGDASLATAIHEGNQLKNFVQLVNCAAGHGGSGGCC